MMITAHSGCDKTVDNSLEYIQYALGIAVNAIEVDIRKNRRGDLVLSHDETYEDAVKLEQAFNLLKEYPDKRINCDLKQPGLEEDVVELAKLCSVENQLIFSGDVNPELFRKGKVQYPEVLWFANMSCFWPEYEVRKQCGITEAEEIEGFELVLEKMRDYEAQGLNWYYKDAEKIWDRAKEMGIGISVWTVNEPEQQEIWLSRKVENITTRCATQLIGIKNNY